MSKCRFFLLKRWNFRERRTRRNCVWILCGSVGLWILLRIALYHFPFVRTTGDRGVWLLTQDRLRREGAKNLPVNCCNSAAVQEARLATSVRQAAGETIEILAGTEERRQAKRTTSNTSNNRTHGGTRARALSRRKRTAVNVPTKGGNYVRTAYCCVL